MDLQCNNASASARPVNNCGCGMDRPKIGTSFRLTRAAADIGDARWTASTLLGTRPRPRPRLVGTGTRWSSC